LNELERLFEALSLQEIMNEPEAVFGIINKPPSFTGKKYELEGFLTRAELAMESRPNQFATDEARVRFLMSYMLGKPLEWVSCLRRNNSPLLNNYVGFIRELSRYVISIYFEITLNHLPIKRSISIKTILTKFRRHGTHDK